MENNSTEQRDERIINEHMLKANCLTRIIVPNIANYVEINHEADALFNFEKDNLFSELVHHVFKGIKNSKITISELGEKRTTDKLYVKTIYNISDFESFTAAIDSVVFVCNEDISYKQGLGRFRLFALININFRSLLQGSLQNRLVITIRDITNLFVKQFIDENTIASYGEKVQEEVKRSYKVLEESEKLNEELKEKATTEFLKLREEKYEMLKLIKESQRLIKIVKRKLKDE
jgi:hypothetical protein